MTSKDICRTRAPQSLWTISPMWGLIRRGWTEPTSDSASAAIPGGEAHAPVPGSLLHKYLLSTPLSNQMDGYRTLMTPGVFLEMGA